MTRVVVLAGDRSCASGVSHLHLRQDRCEEEEAARLRQALDSISKNLFPDPRPRSALRGRSGRHRKTSRTLAVPAALQVSKVPQDAVALVAPAAPDPTKGLVEQQRQAWLQQLSTDRKLEYLRDQRLRSAQKAEVENPREVVVPADDLDPDKVRAVFDLTTQDPAELVAVQRVRRVQESFAVRLEHLLTCDIPESLRGVGVRITSVDFPEWSPAFHVVPLDLVIRFAPLRGQNGDQLQRRLDKAVPELSKELARRLAM